MKFKKKIEKLIKEQIRNLNQLDSSDTVKPFTIRDLKKEHLIDNKTYHEYLKKEINKNYEGSEEDE